MKTNRNRVRIVISGITAWPLSEQIEEAKRLASLEPDALVFLTNRVAGPEGTCFQKNMEALFRALPESLPLGVYECPRPYKKILSQEDIQFLKESRRVSFIKDTCCDREQIKQRAALTKGSAIRLYNANAATLLDSLRWGYVGYSGVMANFHPRLYSWLIQHKNEPMAETVQDYLAIASLIECRDYPVVCKRYLQRFEKIPMLPFSRVIEDRQPDSVNAELDALYRMTKTVEAALLTDMAQ